jgi:phosphoglycolate phosphatase-like HAD superfamily hydrolase
MTTLAAAVEEDRKAREMTVAAYVDHLGLGSATGAAMTWSRIVGAEPRPRPVFAALKHLKASPELAAEALAEVFGVGADTVRVIARSSGGWARVLAKTTGNRAESGAMEIVLEEWFAMIRGEG